MTFTLTTVEADLLLPMGESEFTGSIEEFAAMVTNAYWVIDDAPYAYPERRKMLAIIERLADKHGIEIA